MTRDCALAGNMRSTAGAATAPRPAVMMRRRLMVPGCFMATSLADGSRTQFTVSGACVPDAVQREALAERCSADPGPFQTFPLASGDRLTLRVWNGPGSRPGQV